ncbi:hypothetical protein DSO57_1001273 [Entomophthora muscae]|uniref:Uncharacterized protein n=1 Tax=Entomophthora muscae TaxID=34485 RepID=A0ACC2T950_9FUNG|nr:hypothetical protein DSO57_1001273 [Entomophthora muscae]
MYKRAVKALSQEGGWESESSISSASGSESEENDSDSSDGTDSQSVDVEALLTDLLEKEPELFEMISENKKEYAASTASDSKEKITVTPKEREVKEIPFPCSLCPEKEIYTESAYTSHLTSKIHLRRSKKIEQKDSQVIEATEPKAKASKQHKKRKIYDKTD